MRERIFIRKAEENDFLFDIVIQSITWCSVILVLVSSDLLDALMIGDLLAWYISQCPLF